MSYEVFLVGRAVPVAVFRTAQAGALQFAKRTVPFGASISQDLRSPFQPGVPIWIVAAVVRLRPFVFHG